MLPLATGGRRSLMDRPVSRSAGDRDRNAGADVLAKPCDVRRRQTHASVRDGGAWDPADVGDAVKRDLTRAAVELRQGVGARAEGKGKRLAARAKTEADGPIVAKVTNYILGPTPYSSVK